MTDVCGSADDVVQMCSPNHEGMAPWQKGGGEINKCKAENVFIGKKSLRPELSHMVRITYIHKTKKHNTDPSVTAIAICS